MKYKIILFLVLIAIIFSSILAFSEIPLICGTNDGCTAVQSSSYSTFLGIKNSLIGVFAFIIIGAIIYSHIKNPKKIKKTIINLGIIIGGIIAIYFIYLQLFVIKEICKYCLVVDIATITGAFTLIFWREK